MSVRAKRIVIVSHYYPPHMGGIEMVAHNQAERLAARGHKVTVVTSRLGSKDRPKLPPNVRVKRIAALNIFEKFGVPFPMFEPITLAVALVGAIRQADVVHIHDAVYMPCMTAAIIARFMRKPLVVTQHVALVDHPNRLIMHVQKMLHIFVGYIVYPYSKIVLTLNDRVAAYVIAHGAANEKVKAIMNGTDTTLFHQATQAEKTAACQHFGLDPAKPVVLFVGRFVPKKGFQKVQAAQSSAYQLVFAGGSKPTTGEQHCIYLGKLPQTELAMLYRAADMFVLPSEGEGFPLSVQEAMASGLPVIMAYDKGYDRYQFNNELVRMLPQPTNANVRAAITELVADSAKCRRMSRYSSAYATRHFSWDGIMSQLEDMYEQLASQKDHA